MKRSFIIVLSCFCIGLVFVAFLIKKHSEPKENSVAVTQPPSLAGTPPLEKENSQASSSQKINGSSQRLNEQKDREAQPEKKETIFLTQGNFQDFVVRCFMAVPCELTEDPLKMYNEYKISGNRKANSLLIAYLRSKLKDPAFKEKYKDLLKQMMEDFYPPEKREFQEAVYYNYLGDLNKSLELYLDLEKKSATDPALQVPKLNIANTYYDLGRWREALPYYQAALRQFSVGDQKVAVPIQSEMIQFLQERIDQIRHKLGG